MSSTARYNSYSCRSGLPQNSLPRSVSTRSSLTSCSSKNGSTRSLSRSAAVMGVVELGKAYLGVGVDEGLLVDASNALQIADIERILRAAISWMLALELAVRLLLGLGLFQRDDLRLGQHQAFLGALGFQRLEPLVHRLQVVAQPHTAHTGRGDREPALPQLVGNADLTEGRLLNGERNDGVLDLLRHAVLQHRLLAADFLQAQFAALVVELLEPVAAVAA